ncbi:four helix bundle protein [candidate division KSB1 bacterium]|nr:MAG: four helix bundle protein [candidate division KSB1 bacterium]
MAEPEPLIPKHGGYRKLKSFKIAQLVYDVTMRFCDRYIDKRSRTHDQMVQAARSGVQNIAEGSQVSGTSKKMEMKLTNVARASLEELKLDYEDYLRQKDLEKWVPNDPRRKKLIDRRCGTADEVAVWVKEIYEQHVQCGQSKKSTESMKAAYSEIAANATLVLIGVAVSLLDRQLAAQATAFEKEGGFTEDQQGPTPWPRKLAKNQARKSSKPLNMTTLRARTFPPRNINR